MSENSPFTNSQIQHSLEHNPDYLIKFAIDNNPEAVAENISKYTGKDQELTYEQMYIYIVTLFEAQQFTTVQEILTIPYNETSNDKDYTSGWSEYFVASQSSAVAEDLKDPLNGSTSEGSFFYNVRNAILNVKNAVAPEMSSEDLGKLNLPPAAIKALALVLNLEDTATDVEAAEISVEEQEKKPVIEKIAKVGIPASLVWALVGVVVILIGVVIFKAVNKDV